MNSLLHSPHNLSATGVGPKIFRLMLPFLFAGIAVQILFPSVSAFPLIKAELVTVAGRVLLVTGLLLWIFPLIHFSLAYSKGKLITTGVYSLTRNPIYASWMLFILPGLAGIWNNWIFLLAAQVFGESYHAFMKKVNRVLV